MLIEYTNLIVMIWLGGVLIFFFLGEVVITKQTNFRYKSIQKQSIKKGKINHLCIIFVCFCLSKRSYVYLLLNINLPYLEWNWYSLPPQCTATVKHHQFHTLTWTVAGWQWKFSVSFGGTDLYIKRIAVYYIFYIRNNQLNRNT